MSMISAEANKRLAHRFRELWRRKLGTGQSDETFTTLDAAYGSPERLYHSWCHINTLLGELDQVRSLPEFTSVAFDEVELALFFHDAVYEPARHDNEVRSAALFLDLTSQGGASNEMMLARVTQLIEATATHQPSSDTATRLMIDLDLSILGAPPEVYASYVAGVRQEYHHVPHEVWSGGRIAVLDRFLSRERIYQTETFHIRLESTARANLMAECQQLSRV
jgi:predicted metal-dependent HD superfamily phosphohydrolase